jgi:redox-sensitive bicupin YhaK (pirin superfamily)
MITIYRFKDLGSHKLSWLDSKFHFSFANYYDPKRMGFGKLRVINDDIIKGKTGFDTHPHRDMEIITYVRKGAISHEDSKGNFGRTEAGDVQVMSAGTGIAHSEHNLENEDTTLYQIWIEPHTKGLKPSWGQMEFPKEIVTDSLKLIVSGRPEDQGKDVLHINQYAAIYAGNIKSGTTITQNIKDQAYVLVSKGKIKLDDKELSMGDGAEITDYSSIQITALLDSEILVIDVPK